METFNEIDKILLHVKEIGYWKLNIPSEIDYRLISIINDYINLSQDEKNDLKGRLSLEHSRMILFFSERLATHVLNSPDLSLIKVGINAIDVVYGRIETEEILLILPLYYNLLKRYKLKFSDILNGEESIYSFIDSFGKRKKEDKSLSCMGYTIEKDKNSKLIYKRTW